MHYLIITATLMLFGFMSFQTLRYLDYKFNHKEIETIEGVGY